MKCKIERQHDASKRARSAITKLAKNSVFKRRRTVPCRYCGKPLTRQTATGDHVQPVSAGGVNKLKNIAIACSPCNSRKGSMEVGAFRKLIRAKP